MNNPSVPTPEATLPTSEDVTSNLAESQSISAPDTRTDAERKRDAKINRIANSDRQRRGGTANTAKHSLSQYIRLGSGIRPSESIDLSAIENAQGYNKKGKKKTGFASIIRPSGKNIEDVFRDAIESGFLPGSVSNGETGLAADNFTIDDFIETVADDMRRPKHFSTDHPMFEDTKSIEDAEPNFTRQKPNVKKPKPDSPICRTKNFTGKKRLRILSAMRT